MAAKGESVARHRAVPNYAEAYVRIVPGGGHKRGRALAHPESFESFVVERFAALVNVPATVADEGNWQNPDAVDWVDATDQIAAIFNIRRLTLDEWIRKCWRRDWDHVAQVWRQSWTISAISDEARVTLEKVERECRRLEPLRSFSAAVASWAALETEERRAAVGAIYARMDAEDQRRARAALDEYLFAADIAEQARMMLERAKVAALALVALVENREAA